MTICRNWYTTYHKAGETFSSLIPDHTQGCESSNSTTPQWVTEFVVLTQATMIIGLAFLAYVMWRSMRRYSTDWYRLVGAYLVGTIGVPVSLALAPSTGGFNRIAGFGILVHNLAELFIVIRIWFGNEVNLNRQLTGSKVAILYVWIIMFLVTLLPLLPLFVILMLQGAFLDWMLVYTFYNCGDYMQKRSSGGKYFWFGFAAAFTHILSIQPLFFGFATTYAVLNGITVIFLIPTFILYVWFASADESHATNIIDPIITDQVYQTWDMNQTLHRIEIGVEKSRGFYIPPLQQPLVQQPLIQSPQLAMDSKLAQQKSSSVPLDDIEMARIESNKNSGKLITEVLEEGLFYLNQNDKRVAARYFKRIVILSFLSALIDGAIVLFSPCYIDVEKLVCN